MPGGMGRHGGMGGGGRGGSRCPQQERPDGKKILDRMSRRKPADAFFEVSKKQPIDDIYGQIEEELRNQYSLGYTPAADSGTGYHKILLATKQKDQIVQTRDGYYAGP